MTASAAPALPSVCSVCGAPQRAPLLGEHCPQCLLRLSVETLAPELLAAEGDAPARLGDYELLAEIARGGVGVVYRARQRSLGRTVAVKVLVAGEFASEETRRRFRAEAEAAAGLQHPGIVGIFDVGESDGVAWFSMEYMPGGTLADLARERPLPSRAAAEHARAIAEAVTHAHAQGILHRDLKPSNILLDAAGRPRISDFGIARRFDGEQTLTRTGAVLGSPGYMAPEQAFGDAAQIGQATDVYGLGALLYHLLTGRPPFQGPTLDAILLQLRDSDPVEPRRLNPAVPRDLETICLHCLQKAPAQRYATASEVMEDLGRFLEGKAIRAKPVSAMAKTWRWCRQRPITAALLAALVIATGIALLWRNAALVTEQRRADLAEKFAREQRRTALLARAQLRLQAHDSGRRIQSLEWLREAWSLAPSSEIRDAAIAALTLLDAKETSMPAGVSFLEPFSAPAPSLPNSTRVIQSTSHPPSHRIAAGGYDNLIYLLDAEDGAVIRRLRGHEANCTSLAFSPDGHCLASAADDHTIRLWNARTGEELLVVDQTKYQEKPNLRWSSDGAWLGITDRRALRITHPTVAKFFSPETEETRAEGTCTIDLSADGRWLVTVTETGTWLWHTQNRRIAASFPKSGAEWSAARFSPDSRRLWIGGWNSALRAVDLPASPDDPISAPIHVAEFAGSLMDQSPDGNWLIALSNYGGGFQFVSATEPRRVMWLKQPHPLSLALTLDGRLAATSSYDAPGARLWDVRAQRELRVLPANAPAQLAFTPDGKTLATGSETNLSFWNVETGAHIRQQQLPTRIRSLAYSADGDYLAVETRTGVALLRAKGTNPEWARLTSVPRRSTASFCFDRESRQLAIQDDSGGALVWQLAVLDHELSALGMSWH